MEARDDSCIVVSGTRPTACLRDDNADLQHTCYRTERVGLAGSFVTPSRLSSETQIQFGVLVGFGVFNLNPDLNRSVSQILRE